MTTVRIAIPVTRGKRRFHLDKGRRWSVVEHLILTALSEGEWSAQVLAEQSKLPRRVVMEAIIRLMDASWVELAHRSDGIVFSATESGKSAVKSDELPTRPKRMARWMNFITDKVTGAVYRSRELPIFEKHVLEKRAEVESFIWIEPRDYSIEDHVRAVIATLFDDDERFVAVEPAGDRLVDRFAVVIYRDGKLEGLPSRAPKELEDIIVAAAKSTKSSPKHAATFAPPAVTQDADKSAVAPRSIVFRSDDLILGADEHHDVLKQVIRNCRHELFIHSTFILEDRFNSLMPALRSALERGTKIDILWGDDDSDKSIITKTKKEVDRLRQKIALLSLDDVLKIHPFSTGSHSKLMVADTGRPDKHVAVLGSCNWLSSGIHSFEASVQIRDPFLISDVLYQLAELSRGADGHWTELTNDFARLASSVKHESAPSGPRADAHLVLGPEHGAFVRFARDNAERRLFVTSHRLSAVGRPAVILPAIAAAEAKNIDVKVYYGVPSGRGAGVKAADLTIEASFAGVRIRPVKEPRVHAKLLAWDDDFAVVTSQNWLSADPSEFNKRKEIGLFLHAAGVASRIIDKFESVRKS